MARSRARGSRGQRGAFSAVGSGCSGGLLACQPPAFPGLPGKPGSSKSTWQGLAVPRTHSRATGYCASPYAIPRRAIFGSNEILASAGEEMRKGDHPTSLGVPEEIPRDPKSPQLPGLIRWEWLSPPFLAGRECTYYTVLYVCVCTKYREVKFLPKGISLSCPSVPGPSKPSYMHSSFELFFPLTD